MPGLGWIKADIIKFHSRDSENNLKLPQMGWNTIEIIRKHSLFKGFMGETRFYFVHSYYMVCKDHDNVLTETSYGLNFALAICFENVLGVQFHPEKSHKFGIQLLKNFAELCQC